MTDIPAANTLRFQLRSKTTFGPDYDQAVKDGLERLDAACDTLADIQLLGKHP